MTIIISISIIIVDIIINWYARVVFFIYPRRPVLRLAAPSETGRRRSRGGRASRPPIYIYIYIYIHTYAHIRIHIYILRAYIYIYIYIYTLGDSILA